jgi:hypothetical protein
MAKLRGMLRWLPDYGERAMRAWWIVVPGTFATALGTYGLLAPRTWPQVALSHQVALILLIVGLIVAPFGAYASMREENEKLKEEINDSRRKPPATIHHVHGDQTINYNFNVSPADLARLVPGTAGGAPTVGSETYVAPSQTVSDRVHRAKGHADSISPQLSLPLPSESPQTASEEYREPNS